MAHPSNRPDWVYNIKNRPMFDVRQFGAKCDGVTVDTNAVQNAIIAAIAANGRLIFPSGITLIDNEIECVIPAAGCIWMNGQGRGPASVIKMKHNAGLHTIFNINSPAGLYTTNGGISNLSFLLEQPNSTNPADMYHYAPTINIDTINQFKIKDIDIIGPWVGLQVRNNNGLDARNISMSPFSQGINLDNCQDTCYISHHHIWPHGLTVNQALALIASANTGIVSGRVDDLKLISPTYLTGQQSCNFLAGAGGLGTTGFIKHAWFDNVGNISVTAGRIILDGGFVSASGAASPAIDVNGGCCVEIDKIQLIANAVTVNPVIRFRVTKDNSSTPGALLSSCKITNSFLYFGTYDGSIPIYGEAANPAQLWYDFTLAHNTIYRNPGFAYNQRTIVMAAPCAAGGRVRNVLTGNTFVDNQSGSGVAVRWENDDYHVATGNAGPGWTHESPGGYTNNRWVGNAGAGFKVDH